MDDTGEVSHQPIFLMDDLQFTPTLAFALGRIRHLVSNEKREIKETAKAVADELITDCTRKNHVAKSCRAVSRQLALEVNKKTAFKRKLKKLLGEEKDNALREWKQAMLEPMDVRANTDGPQKSTGNASSARASAELPRKAFLASLMRNSEIENRSPLLPECPKDDSPYLNLRGKKDAAKVRPLDPPPPPPPLVTLPDTPCSQCLSPTRRRMKTQVWLPALAGLFLLAPADAKSAKLLRVRFATAWESTKSVKKIAEAFSWR